MKALLSKDIDYRLIDVLFPALSLLSLLCFCLLFPFYPVCHFDVLIIFKAFLKYMCSVYSMDRGAWWATIHGVAESNVTEHTFNK